MAKVMIVEDNKRVMESLADILEFEGHTIIKWPCTTAAEHVIDLKHPDVVLTDNNLGEGEEKGIDMAVRFKDKGIKVLLMSGDDLSEEADEKGIPFYMKASPLPLLFSKLEEACRG